MRDLRATESVRILKEVQGGCMQGGFRYPRTAESVRIFKWDESTFFSRIYLSYTIFFAIKPWIHLRRPLLICTDSAVRGYVRRPLIISTDSAVRGYLRRPLIIRTFKKSVRGSLHMLPLTSCQNCFEKFSLCGQFPKYGHFFPKCGTDLVFSWKKIGGKVRIISFR